MEVALSVITKYLITIMCLVYGVSSVTVLSARTEHREQVLILYVCISFCFLPDSLFAD